MKETSRIKAAEKATKRTWEEWLAFLDGIDAKSLSHHEIATIVLGELDSVMDNHAWWAQSVTVAYEQHIGRRIPGQRSDGTIQTSVSRATPLGMQALMDQWVEFAARDEAVLAMVAAEVRVSGTEKRITWRTKAPDGSSIRVTSEPRKNDTASIVVNHMELQTLELNTEAKAKWAAILERFLDEIQS